MRISVQGWGIGRGADGSWYEGCWREGRRSGEGRQWGCDGDFYHGGWLDDLPHGQGILVHGEWPSECSCSHEPCACQQPKCFSAQATATASRGSSTVA